VSTVVVPSLRRVRHKAIIFNFMPKHFNMAFLWKMKIGQPPHSQAKNVM
jgi:hypothetical protein